MEVDCSEKTVAYYSIMLISAIKSYSIQSSSVNYCKKDLSYWIWPWMTFESISNVSTRSYAQVVSVLLANIRQG
jgi:hypothetical protein